MVRHGLWLALAMGLLGTSAHAEVSSVTVVGAYSNLVFTGEHAQGYSIELWRDGNQYFGLFLSAAGLAADMPTGVLDNLRYDPDRRTLSFKAKLTMGVTTVDGQTWTPTRDVYQFDGTFFPDQIAGNLIHINALQPDRSATQEDIKLYRAKEQEESMPRPASYAEWAELTRTLLAARGPKW